MRARTADEKVQECPRGGYHTSLFGHPVLVTFEVNGWNGSAECWLLWLSYALQLLCLCMAVGSVDGSYDFSPIADGGFCAVFCRLSKYDYLQATCRRVPAPCVRATKHKTVVLACCDQVISHHQLAVRLNYVGLAL
jgi:hypothetical protein